MCGLLPPAAQSTARLLVLPVLSCGARGPPVRGGHRPFVGGGVPTRPHSWLRAWASLKELFENVDATTIMDFVKEVNFYHLV